MERRRLTGSVMIWKILIDSEQKLTLTLRVKLKSLLSNLYVIKFNYRLLLRGLEFTRSSGACDAFNDIL